MKQPERFKKVAHRRYYMNRIMKQYKVDIDPITRTIKLPYSSFMEIPIGLRFYIGQCIQMQYNIQYELF